jgi:hypothetical protein
MSAVPWTVAGLVLFGFGLLYPRYRKKMAESLSGPDRGRSSSDIWDGPEESDDDEPSRAA